MPAIAADPAHPVVIEQYQSQGCSSCPPAIAAAPATVWLVHHDGRTLDVPIRAGENGGGALVHRNVVRSIDRLGSWTGPRVTFAVPAPGNTADRTALPVQQGSGGPIIAAARL